MEPNLNLQGIGIPYYSEAEWAKAKAVMTDGATFHATYAEFEAKVAKRQAELLQLGQATVRVNLTMAEFLPWCAISGREVNRQSGAEFAALKAAQQDGGRR